MFAFHEEEIALPQLLATLRALRITQDVKDDEFFGLKRGSDLALPYHHASAVHLLRLLHIRRIRAKDPPLPRSSMWAGSRDPREDFSFDVQPVLLAVFCLGLFQRAGLVL